MLKKSVIVIGIACVLSGIANASDKTDITLLVSQWGDIFNKTDGAAAATICTPDAVIMDDFAPHIWKGSAACTAYIKDVVAYEEKSELTGAMVAFGAKPKTFTVTGKTAYFVTTGTFSGTEKGKPISEKAIATFVLNKTAAGWRVAGMTWSDL